MFNVKTILFISIFAIFYISCQKPPLFENNPSINFKKNNGSIYSDTTIAAGKQYIISIIAKSQNGKNLTNLIVTSNGQRIIDKGFNLPEIEEEIILTKTIDETELISIIIINKARKRDTISLMIKKMNYPYLPISRKKSDLIGAQTNNSFGNYFSFSSGKIYSQSQAYENQKFIDLVYYFDGSGDANTLASPGANLSGIIGGSDAPDKWLLKNNTRFSREALMITNDEFDKTDNDSLILAHLFTDGGRKAKQLKNGQYFGFQTNENKYGILKIESVVGQSEGTIQLSYIIQQ